MNEQHEILAFKLSDQEASKILKRHHTIAVVGCSTNPDKPSHRVPKYLQDHGFRIIPVNPMAKGQILLGETVVGSLKEIPFPVEIVDIFRPSADVPPIVEEAIAIGATVVWMQEGIINHAAARRAQESGLVVVMDKCMMKIHRTL